MSDASETVALPEPGPPEAPTAPRLLARWRDDPNPVWLREMRQSARLKRTPIILATVTALASLLISAVGGLASTSAAPAEVGVALYHTFFSLAFAVVTWLGPGVAAMTIASERSGQTWEALLLTGLGARTIARGKFLAALTYITLYLVMLAPVGALPFLFGGVTAGEVLIAFALLLLLAALSVGFGLSISSALTSPGLAVVVTLPVAVTQSIIAYVGLGVGLSFLAHEQWPAVLGGAPVWLPTAYVRADFGAEYLVYLVLIPIGTISLLAWFFYEATIANMLAGSDDRSTGLKTWFLTALPGFSVMAISPVALLRTDQWVAALIGMSVLYTICLLALFLFAGEALEPSDRVVVHWDRAGAGRLRRFLGPGIVNTMTLVLMLAIGSLGALAAIGALLEMRAAGPKASEHMKAIGIVTGYFAAFFLFLSGFVTWTRARSVSGTAPRLLLLLALFTAIVGPWLAMAIAGVFTTSLGDALLIAAPSPGYALAMIDALGSPGHSASRVLAAGVVCMIGWTLAGLLLFAFGRSRVRRLCERSREARHQMEARLFGNESSTPEKSAAALEE